MILLSKFELRLLSELLSLAADEFSNHGCNDYVLENTPEARKFMAGVETWNSPEEYEEYGIHISEDGKEIYTMDHLLISYFAHLAESGANDMQEYEDSVEDGFDEPKIEVSE